MAAYAALVSVMQIIHQLQNHPLPPISLDNQQVDALTEKVNLLQKFLEGYDSPFGYSDQADPLEMRIADAAYAAEDVIESYIVDNIKLVAQTTHYDDDADDADGSDCATNDAEADDNAADDDYYYYYHYFYNYQYYYYYYYYYDNDSNFVDGDGDDDDADANVNEVKEISCISFYEDVQKVIEEMDLLVREVTQMVGEKATVERSVVSRDDAAVGSISSERKSEMVGFDDMLLELLDRLTGGRSNRQIIPIVGMGGVGKTTLALNVFQNQLIKESFDICVWATISQNYDIRETLAQVLSQVRGNSVDMSEEELGEEVYKFFCGRKYLIVMDDMWSLEVWDKMKFFFPEYNNGSRVLVTTRLSNMATDLTDSNILVNVKSLDEISSWCLFSKTVFGEDGTFPLELEEIGNKIVGKCNGHPLTIVVIGGLLAKSQHSREHWEEIEANLISRVNSENDEYCLRILRMSYNHLPMCLKPCFLYMGVFEEDDKIDVSTLIKLWVSEGFVKPRRDNKNLESIAGEYLKELVDRNLVLVAELGSLGNVRFCKMHDLLRDVCLKEAKKQRFFYDVSDRQDSPLGMDKQRRIVIRRGGSSSAPLIDDVLANMVSHVRSILCDDRYQHLSLLRDFRMLRILSVAGESEYRIDDVFQYVNLRYINIRIVDRKIPSSINLLWNLHTFSPSVPGGRSVALTEIWKMHQLRHVGARSEWYLPDPPNDSSVIMENLQTLKGVKNLNLNEEVVKRIPNIRKLFVVYSDASTVVNYLLNTSNNLHFDVLVNSEIKTANCLSYLQHLSKLESFTCCIQYVSSEFLQKISFPKSLKKLSLVIPKCCGLEDILPKIGSLPLLQKLTLAGGVFRSRKWETIEGHFPSLRVLQLIKCGYLKRWMVSESSHFPRLQNLRLSHLEDLEEIPSEIGEIATLKSIVLNWCSESAVLSAKKIVDEQEELHGEPDLHVSVGCKDDANAFEYWDPLKFGL